MSRRQQLFIDGQIFQTTARDRGLGRYSACIVKALIDAKTHDVTILLSKHLSFRDDDETELKRLFRGATFRELDLWTTAHHKLEDCFRHNVGVLNRYLATAGRGQGAFFIPALFQEPLAAVFPDKGVVTKTLLFHDLIPYLYHGRYEPVMQWTNYLKRFRFIFEADLVFTNSQTVADDLHIYLGLPTHRICRIDGAAIHTTKESVRPPQVDTSRPFMLFNTSDDPRKNNLRTVLAFEQFRRTTGHDWSLVLTSHFSKREREQLQRFSKHLQFSGSVHERHLNWLFEHCELVVFTPESEGLGLPALEAVAFGKKAVCSNITVMREISDKAFFYCSPDSSHSIAQALERAVGPNAVVDRIAYDRIQDYYSWPKTAERLLAGLKKWRPLPAVKRPKLAIVTATPSGLTGVGLTSGFLHPTLAEHFDIDYYLESGLSSRTARPNYLQYVAPCYPATAFSAERYGRYDAVFYHIGNGDYHLESITSALNLPGFLIVHDTTLVEAYRVMREIGMMSDARVRLEARLDAVKHTKHSQYYSSLANRQLGLLVHSEYAQQAMAEILDEPVPIVRTGLPTMVPELDNPSDNGRLVIGLAGAIADVKGLEVIESIARDPQFSDCDIHLFGFGHASPERLAQLEGLGNVSIETNVTDFQFQTSFAKLDVFVNYRMIYKGENSNTTLEAMRYGVVPIVRKIGWYDELPDEVAVKVASPEEVISQLYDLIKDRERLRAMGQRGKQYVLKTYTAERFVRAMQALMAASKKGRPNVALASALKAGQITKARDLVDFRDKGEG